MTKSIYKDQTGFSAVAVLVVIVVLAVIGGTGYYVTKQINKSHDDTSVTTPNGTATPASTVAPGAN